MYRIFVFLQIFVLNLHKLLRFNNITASHSIQDFYSHEFKLCGSYGLFKVAHLSACPQFHAESLPRQEVLGVRLTHAYSDLVRISRVSMPASEPESLKSKGFGIRWVLGLRKIENERLRKRGASFGWKPQFCVIIAEKIACINFRNSFFVLRYRDRWLALVIPTYRWSQRASHLCWTRLRRHHSYDLIDRFDVVFCLEVIPIEIFRSDARVFWLILRRRSGWLVQHFSWALKVVRGLLLILGP